MPRAISCINPLNKKNHKCVYKNLVLVTDQWNYKFTQFVGQFVCVSCESAINKQEKVNIEFIFEPQIIYILFITSIILVYVILNFFNLLYLYFNLMF